MFKKVVYHLKLKLMTIRSHMDEIIRISITNLALIDAYILFEFNVSTIDRSQQRTSRRNVSFKLLLRQF